MLIIIFFMADIASATSKREFDGSGAQQRAPSQVAPRKNTVGRLRHWYFGSIKAPS